VRATFGRRGDAITMTSHTCRGVACVVVLVALCGCASARLRLERGLVRVGVDRPVAACMAGQMADHLSIGQLRKIGQLRRLDDDIARGLTLDRFLDDIRALGDPEIVAVTSAAGAICWALNPRS
jgi:hypothetical protein